MFAAIAPKIAPAEARLPSAPLGWGKAFPGPLLHTSSIKKGGPLLYGQTTLDIRWAPIIYRRRLSKEWPPLLMREVLSLLPSTQGVRVLA